MSSVNDYSGDPTGSPYAFMSPGAASGSPYGAGVGMTGSEQPPKILLMGARRAGKSSIQRVVFQKMSPHETLFLESTNGLDIKFIANNSFVQFQIWDMPGFYDFHDGILYGGQTYTAEAILNNCGSIVFVIDAQDDPYTEALEFLLDTITRTHPMNPKLSYDVFIHKVDGDLFLGDEAKLECQNVIEGQVTKDLAEAGITDAHVSFYLTSIYDHSVFDTFSRVVQKLIPQLPTLENLLNSLIASCGIDKAFLFDVVSKIYIATDSNPVDVQSYELCSDMIDVVIDVSCIYGMKDEGEGYAYDSKSASMIRLTGGEFSGRVLYLREVSSYLALVCLLKAENFEKHGLIDFNIDAFKSALGKVFQVAKHRRKAEVGAAPSAAGSGAPRAPAAGAGAGGAGAGAPRGRPDAA